MCVVDQMEDFQIAMCACTDRACADQVHEALTKWGNAMVKHASKTRKPDATLVQRSGEIMTEYTTCMTNLLTRP